ncbi:hypothetical protein HYPSUDRAFT_470278 [Hypholoma sublateritium FD-334 SS-4]|uniref:Uncharacterized protein n=1 Tax=Hypholoma sublateritium (strain FD-334 SS-4) TaxID=945553 RepID=A0A0D2KH40_HYPSF|nr:hypothetical protein HYPSUDRAFT_470278 [Hypholoma sublateritium FD-334 SS-4]
MYYDYYIRAFRSNRGSSPTLSSHSSRPSFDTLAEMIDDTLMTNPQSHAAAKKSSCPRWSTLRHNRRIRN